MQLSLYHLRRIDGMMMQPPYWHRLCAFTQAGLLIRLMDDLTFDPSEMTQSLESTRLVSDGLADILALRSEPTWRLGHLTREDLQAVVIGRLKMLESHEEMEGRQFPHSEILNRRIETFMAEGISPFSPGPLEGGVRPIDRQSERTLPDKPVSELTAMLNDAPREFPWHWVATWLSAEFFLPDSMRDSLD